MTLDPAEDITEQRQHVHAYIDRLPGDQLTAVHGLLETMLSPLDRKLALAPLDDEPVTPEDLAAIQAGVASLKREGGVPIEQVLGDFRLTMEDLHQMARTSDSEDIA